MNWLSEGKETLITGWDRQGGVERSFVAGEGPGSKDGGRVLGGLYLEEAVNSTEVDGADGACVVDICFDDWEWEKWAANFELRDGVGTLLCVESRGTCALAIVDTDAYRGTISVQEIYREWFR